jgi:micrococcal nuclease
MSVVRRNNCNALRSSLIYGMLLLSTGCSKNPPSKQILVIDGDTVVQSGQHFRLVGLNTPELSASCHYEWQIADRAKARLIQLVSGPTRLKRVSCNCRWYPEGHPKCNYGRLCARLFVNGLDWASIAIREGLAEPYNCQNGRCPRRRDWCS